MGEIRSDGTVEMMYIGGPVMESFNEDFIVFNLPYMFDSIEVKPSGSGSEADVPTMASVVLCICSAWQVLQDFRLALKE